MSEIYKVDWSMTGTAFIRAADATEASNAIYDVDPVELVQSSIKVDPDAALDTPPVHQGKVPYGAYEIKYGLDDEEGS